jgi:hypothetical protein
MCFVGCSFELDSINIESGLLQFTREERPKRPQTGFLRFLGDFREAL